MRPFDETVNCNYIQFPGGVPVLVSVIRRGPKNSRIRHADGTNELVPNSTLCSTSVKESKPGSFHPSRIIPSTPLRTLYEKIKNMKGGKQRIKECIDQTLGGERNTHEAILVELFLRSIDCFKRYDNSEEHFVDAEREKRGLAVEKNKFARDCVLGIRNAGDIALPGTAANTMRFLSWELDPRRTTQSIHDNGKSARGSGTGGMDCLLKAADGLPVIGEVKSAGDKSATYALIQLLTYASELLTPAQWQRLAKHVNGLSDVKEAAPGMHLAIILQKNNHNGPEDRIFCDSLAKGIRMHAEAGQLIRGIYILLANQSSTGWDFEVRAHF